MFARESFFVLDKGLLVRAEYTAERLLFSL